MDGLAEEGRGAGRPRFSRLVKGFAAGGVCLMLGLVWWQRYADDFGRAVLAVENALGGVVPAVENALGLNREPEPVSGSVTVNGRPLARGRIKFTPLDPSPPPTGFYTESDVRDGNYAFPRGAGPPPGGYAVMVERWIPDFGLAYQEAERGRPALLYDMRKKNQVHTKAAVKDGVKNHFRLDVSGW